MSIKTEGKQVNPAILWDNISFGFPRWQSVLSCLKKCRILGAAFLLIAIILLLIYSVVAYPPGESYRNQGFFIVLALGVLAGLGLMMTLLWKDYIGPLLDTEIWIQKMRSGELTSKIPVPHHGQISELAVDLNDFGTMMYHLSRNTEQQLVKFTEYTEQKTLSLTILYDVASSINSSKNLSDLLEKFLETLTGIIHASAGAVRLINADDQMELVSSIGFNDELLSYEKITPSHNCICNLNISYDGFVFQDNLLPCQEHVDHPFFQQNLGLIVVPLQYQGQTLGVFNLFIEKQYYQDNSDYKELFTSIGKHLGMAIAKSRLDTESSKLSIIQERNRLSYELHDSLAQTLTSIRFQLRILDEVLHQDDEVERRKQLERIENTVEEANTELRSLIAHFQAPISSLALIDALSDMVKRFRYESEIPVFFQNRANDSLQLTDRVHLEVMRIAQEALNNIRKHSKATAARVMVRILENNRIQILIEDDGVGIQISSKDALPGEQIGLKSMRERAARIKAGFTLESEPGEGVRLILEIDQENKKPEDVVTIDSNTQH